MRDPPSSSRGVQCLIVKSLYLTSFHPGLKMLTVLLHQKMDCGLYLAVTKDTQANAARTTADAPGYSPRKACAPAPCPL